MKKLIKLITVGAASLVALLAIKAAAADVPPYLHAVTKVSTATGAALRSMSDEQLAAIEGGEELIVISITGRWLKGWLGKKSKINVRRINQVGRNNTAVITQRIK